jgi:transposase
MQSTEPTIIELDIRKLEEAFDRAQTTLDPKDFALFKTMAESYLYFAEYIGSKNATIARLRKMIFGATTEKTAAVCGKKSDTPSDVDSAAAPGPSADAKNSGKKPPQGHGRNGADAYSGGEKVRVALESLQAGDACPSCGQGTVYDSIPGVVLRLVGQSPIHATIYELQKLRCNLCGTLFTATSPVGEEKYDATAGSMIALLKYGSGMPFHRMEGLQEHLGIPLPASTQWDIVRDKAERVEPAFNELIRQAAQGDVLHNDDTTVKILELMNQRKARQEALAEDATGGSAEKDRSQRSGMFTTGIVSISKEHKIALFLSGQKHAGENLKEVLVQRAAELPAPIQMCDALSRNMPAGLKTVLSHCLAHGRRQFVDVAEQFPEECRHVLESFSVVYRHDAVARERNLSPAERLLFHQAQSGPTMAELHAWLGRQFPERRVERNSGLGGAISYLLKHWEKLTLFLRVAGAPLDNNICERALKKAILHRKNALFYKTCNGAHVGDIYMSLIYTCEFCGANPFDYLTALERHAGELSGNPQNWMPWNYRQTLDGTATLSKPHR